MATLKSGLNSGSGFSNGDTVTSTTLNNHINDGTVTNIVFDDLASALVIDADDMTGNSATTLSTSESIKAYVDASRPKYVVATGASHALTLQNQSNGTTKTYNIADFAASGQSGFSTSQIIAVFGSAMTISQGSHNEINVISNGQTFRISRAAIAGGSGQAEDAASFNIPINAGQSNIQFSFTNNNTGASTFNEIAIKGFIIQETL